MKSGKINKGIIIVWIEEIYEDLRVYAISRFGINTADDMTNKTIEYLLKNKDRLENSINDARHLYFYSKMKLENEYKAYIKKSSREQQFKEFDDDGDYELELSESTIFDSSINEHDLDDYIDLKKVMAKLSAKCRELLIMKGKGDTPSEIADKLGIPIGTVGQRGTRCLQKARELFFANPQEA